MSGFDFDTAHLLAGGLVLISMMMLYQDRLTALINAALDEPVGYLNPNLYAALPYTSVYRDINDGISNAQGGAPGYRSGPGWDACTGFGSIVGAAFEIALQGVGLRDAVSIRPLRTAGSSSVTSRIGTEAAAAARIRPSPFGASAPRRSSVKPRP